MVWRLVDEKVVSLVVVMAAPKVVSVSNLVGEMAAWLVAAKAVEINRNKVGILVGLG